MAVIQYITPTQPAGSTNGLTMYKNGSQLCMRARAYPLPNQSQRHIEPMNAIAILSMLWESPLTNADRIGWGNYAFATPLEDAYGNPRYVKGYAHFMRVNRPLLQHGLPLQLLPPTVTGLPTFTPAALVTLKGTTTVRVTINPADTWATTTGSHMMLWISRQRSPRRRYPPEVYRPLGTVAGDSTTPPSSTQTYINPWGAVSDQAAQWLRPSIIDVSGRLSNKTNSGTNPNPKTMGTVSNPILPCPSLPVITYNINVGTITRGGTFPTCIAMPGTPFFNINATNVAGSFWVGTRVIGGSTYLYSYRILCPVFGGHVPARLDITGPGGVVASWTGSMDPFGQGTMTGVTSCTLPTTATITQL